MTKTWFWLVVVFVVLAVWVIAWGAIYLLEREDEGRVE